ncbi:unnamed protein product [Cuscuta campestris]|uniref:Myeloid leukemia factor n=1 Tax=Cuscuta campestris TaxID=132261 RepID=A0A484MAU3_9ASTE|nr:unnamed protein product [Cuscuta campestris]
MCSKLFPVTDDQLAGNIKNIRPVPKETRPDDLPRASKPTGPVIEELDTNDDDDEEEDEEEKCGDNRHRRSRSDDWTNRNPLVEHQEDQADEHNKANSMRKNSSFGNIEGTRSVSYTRVTYGGINGAYLTASTSRLTGSDGRVWKETRHADTTTGEATHRISRGIHDKGHTVTRKLKSDGKVDAMETLHNLEKDDLVGFEQDWKGNTSMRMPRWNDGLDFHPQRALKYDANNNRGAPISSFLTKCDSPFRDGLGGPRPDLDVTAHPSGGRPKKVIRINIE